MHNGRQVESVRNGDIKNLVLKFTYAKNNLVRRLPPRHILFLLHDKKKKGRDQIPLISLSWPSIVTNVVFPHPSGAVSRSCCFFLFNSCVFNTFKGTSIPTVKSGGLGTSHDTNGLGNLFTSFNLSSCILLMICWITSVSGL